ncbi:exosome complex component CSL4 isoform X2 [Castor canadensis]|uniref:exosome complex component CSL4 isoform X2 n=1 Tax=Castor canadensis TaxID=51338 RepID=UPI003D164C09
MTNVPIDAFLTGELRLDVTNEKLALFSSGTTAVMAPPVRYCIPGERLCNLEEGSPGSGTYTRHGYIFSSLAGCLTKTSENGALPVISVMRETESQLLPDVGAIVTCKVEIYKSFHPGDIVLAKVISLGDAQSNYLLTTAENELGVVVAHSESGVQMIPISWCEMQCPKTHTKEFRKVARVQPEFLQT